MPTSTVAKYHFLTNTTQPVAGIEALQLAKIRSEIKAKIGLNDLQFAEMAAFSMAMITRYALGLSASGGQVGVLVSDCMAGWVALAAARHLVNNGTLVTIIEQDQAKSDTFKRLLTSALASKVDHSPYENGAALVNLTKQLDGFHNLIVGCSDLEAAPGATLSKETIEAIEAINEHRVPAHAIELSLGINPNDGLRNQVGLYAASTLALGMPLNVLTAAKDYVGRLYICDISIPWEYYLQSGITDQPLFSEQPVLQLNFRETE